MIAVHRYPRSAPSAALAVQLLRDSLRILQQLRGVNALNALKFIPVTASIPQMPGNEPE